MTRSTIDLVRLETMTRNKRTPREIAHSLKCCVETVQNWQVKLGLRNRRVRFPNQYCQEAPIGYDEAERDQWKQTGSWPENLHFDSLTIKPAPSRKPKAPDEGSYCGNSSEMCAA